MLPQVRIFRQAEHVTEPEPVTQGEDFRGAVVAVGPQQDVGRRPMAADMPDRTPDVGGDLLAGRAQHSPTKRPSPSKTTTGWKPY